MSHSCCFIFHHTIFNQNVRFNARRNRNTAPSTHLLHVAEGNKIDQHFKKRFGDLLFQVSFVNINKRGTFEIPFVAHKLPWSEWTLSAWLYNLRCTHTYGKKKYQIVLLSSSAFSVRTTIHSPNLKLVIVGQWFSLGEPYNGRTSVNPHLNLQQKVKCPPFATAPVNPPGFLQEKIISHSSFKKIIVEYSGVWLYYWFGLIKEWIESNRFLWKDKWSDGGMWNGVSWVKRLFWRRRLLSN